LPFRSYEVLELLPVAVLKTGKPCLVKIIN
jgi:hypothetical protein